MSSYEIHSPPNPRSPPEEPIGISNPTTRPEKDQRELPNPRPSINVTRTYENLDTEIITTTVDKLMLALRDHRKAFRGKSEWMGPLGILLTIVASLASSNFSPTLGLSASTWAALFIFCGILTSLWLTVSLARLFQSIGKGGLDELVDRIRGNLDDSP